MAEFPVDPMLAKMIIQSEKYGVSGELSWFPCVKLPPKGKMAVAAAVVSLLHLPASQPAVS